MSDTIISTRTGYAVWGDEADAERVLRGPGCGSVGRALPGVAVGVESRRAIVGSYVSDDERSERSITSDALVLVEGGCRDGADARVVPVDAREGPAAVEAAAALATELAGLGRPLEDRPEVVLGTVRFAASKRVPAGEVRLVGVETRTARCVVMEFAYLGGAAPRLPEDAPGARVRRTRDTSAIGGAVKRITDVAVAWAAGDDAPQVLSDKV